MGGAGLVNKGFSHWSSRNGTKELRSRRKRRKQQQHNLIICNLHCWLVPCGGRNLRGGRLFSFFSVSISYGAPTDLFNGFPFFPFSFSFFANLSMGSRRRTARAQGGRLAAAAWERNGFKARRESEREVFGPRLTKRELPPNSLFLFSSFLSIISSTDLFLLDLDTRIPCSIYNLRLAMRVFSLSTLHVFFVSACSGFFSVSPFCRLCRHRFVLRLALVGFLEGGREGEGASGRSSGGGGGRKGFLGPWSFQQDSTYLPTYLDQQKFAYIREPDSIPGRPFLTAHAMTAFWAANNCQFVTGRENEPRGNRHGGVGVLSKTLDTDTDTGRGERVLRRQMDR